MDTTTLPKGHFHFTSESVTGGHPDKMCDIISDSILDACLEQDKDSRVACESLVKSNMVVIAGEISTNADINIEQIVRKVIKEVGYDDEEVGINYENCEIVINVNKQSNEIAKSVNNEENNNDLGAGDQGIMFGYASDETKEYMPLSHKLALALSSRLTEARKNGEIEWLRPDGKTQVTVEYKKDGKGFITPVNVHTVLISTMHAKGIDQETIFKEIKEKVINKVIPSELLTEKTRYIINPSGSFVFGGPFADAGLTGRKIIVDTYGGWGAHGGGAFSGKDPSKVDRSGAYVTRWIAKSLVAAGFAKRCLVQISYSIGLTEPLSVYVDTYGTVKEGLEDGDLIEIIKKNFDLRPKAIIQNLDLLRPQFAKTAQGGHFGRDDEGFEWEKVKELKSE